MTRVHECCCEYALSDDSMGEQVRSQPIATDRRKINQSRSNCAETLTLLFTKLHLEPHHSQTCSAGGWAEVISPKKKGRGREGKTCDTVAVKISSCLNFSFTRASLHVNTSTHPHKYTRTYTTIKAQTTIHTYCMHIHTNMHTHTSVFPVKDVGKPVTLLTKKRKLIYLFEFRVITGITSALCCDISLWNQMSECAK